MQDATTPSLSLQNEGVPVLITIPQTQAQIVDQGYTYNQATFSFNQTGVDYGGIYNQDENSLPLLTTATRITPKMTVLTEPMFFDLLISGTDALFENQGYTYNQTGYSFNQTGVEYGGIYNQNEDIIPATLSFYDLYRQKQTFSFIPLGPGFFMFITQ